MTQDLTLRWKRARIPAQFRGRGLDTFQPYDEASDMAVRHAADYVEDFPQHAASGHGLLILGQPGSGKGQLGCAVLTEVHRRHRRNIRYTHAQIHAQALMDAIGLRREAERGSEEASQRLDLIMQSRYDLERRTLILIDGLGMERSSNGFYGEQLASLLRVRHDSELPTIITSPLRLALWDGVYPLGMRTLVEAMSTAVILSGTRKAA